MCCATLTMCVKLETEDYTFKFLLFLIRTIMP